MRAKHPRNKWYPRLIAVAGGQRRKYQPDFHAYEREKKQWVALHPDCTGEEYTAAMHEIAVRCGI